MKTIYLSSLLILGLSIATSCKKDEPTPETTPTTPAFRSNIDYSEVNDTIPYNSLFVDANGDTTVVTTEGNDALNILKALDAYAKLPNPVGSTAVLDATVLSNMFANSGSPFTGNYAFLNTSPQQLRNKTALTHVNPESVRQDMEVFFSRLAAASGSVSDSAYEGNAGKLGTRLFDENGIEWCQVIAKSLMGAYQLDFIGNHLLSNANLEHANNSKLVEGKKYTELEHVWDEAYASLTLNKRIYQNKTANSSAESFIASYIWEYNKDDFPLLHGFFLKGRVAIVKNDIAEVKRQAQNIRAAMEKALAKAAIGYMGKAKDANAGVAAHALGEGLGFVYSLRFCQLNGGTDQFSEDQLELLGFYGTGYWGLTPQKLDEVVTNINTRFNF